MLEVDMEALETDGYTHVLVNIPPTDDMVEVWIDIHSEGGRSRTINLPAFIRSFTPMLVEDSTPLHAATYNVTLRGLTELWQSYQVTVKPRNNGHTGITYMVELDIPPYTSNTTPTIKFILNPQCTYTIIIQSSLVGVFRRVVLLYGTQVPTYITVHLLLTLAKQLKTMGESGECPSFFTSIVTLTPLAVVPFVKITNLILRNVDIMDDFTLLGTIGEELPLLPIILFLGTLPFTLLLGATIWVVIVLSGHTLHTILIRILGRNLVGIGNTGITSEITLATLHTLPALVSVTLLSVCYVTCGSLTLTLAVIYYFVKISRLYENYLEKNVTWINNNNNTTTTTGNTDNRGGNNDNRSGNSDNSGETEELATLATLTTEDLATPLTTRRIW
ncbi:hypothetical protein Pcinc_031962 [Petrolisthes cinctipes]|uniref:Uncharacterized protein n=1 Tax=Petrolisthes cinctipes TaxID=88211 RepID=A0AAE1K1T7_PETCI|nr:hypothetical protein Pcinc_031962 [Petrolisthes cinctipes]